MKLDRIDKRILSELQQNSRISNLELADKVGLSPSPCLRRVKALEDAGLIIKHVALLNPKALGLKLTAYVHITMDHHTPERFSHFEKHLRDFPEVIGCDLITGNDVDYQLKVVTQDMEEYQKFLLGKLTRIEGVTGVRSSFILQSIIDKTELPI